MLFMARLLLLTAYSWQTLVAANPAVTLEVWYTTHCPNCQELIHYGLLPLVEAGLPGDQVEILAHPWRNGQNGPDGLYQPVPGDFTSIGHMCAFRDALPMPAPIDSPSLKSAVKFLACDMDDLIIPGVKRDANSVSKCADAAGLHWDGPDGIKACAEGGPNAKGYELMHSRAYTDLVQAASSHIQVEAVTPFVFLNGDLLECSGPTHCVATVNQQGQLVPLATPGSLLEVICSMLSPKPAACVADGTSAAGESSAATTTEKKFHPACENCAEVGKFHWAPSSQMVWPATIVPFCASAILLLRFVSAKGRRQQHSHSLLGGNIGSDDVADSADVDASMSPCE